MCVGTTPSKRWNDRRSLKLFLLQALMGGCDNQKQIMANRSPGGGGGVLPHMGYIGMCGPKGYGFSAVLVINRVSILADFGHFGHK